MLIFVSHPVEMSSSVTYATSGYAGISGTAGDVFVSPVRKIYAKEYI